MVLKNARVWRSMNRYGCFSYQGLLRGHSLTTDEALPDPDRSLEAIKGRVSQ